MTKSVYRNTDRHNDDQDLSIIACNFTDSTATASKGTKAYVILMAGGNPNRLFLKYQSRGGRWIKKWENRKRLSNFRRQTIPPEHPMYQHAYPTDVYAKLTQSLG